MYQENNARITQQLQIITSPPLLNVQEHVGDYKVYAMSCIKRGWGECIKHQIAFKRQSNKKQNILC